MMLLIRIRNQVKDVNHLYIVRGGASTYAGVAQLVRASGF